MAALMIAALLFALGAAAPEPAEPPDAPPDESEVAPPEPAPREGSSAPPPDQAGGYAVPPEEEGSALRELGRLLLAPPRLAWAVIGAPIRGAFWALDEYQLDERAIDFFFNEEETFGVFPTAFFETGFSPNVGARLVHRDLLGAGENLQLRAGYGGRYLQVYEGKIASGRRFGGGVQLELSSRYRLKPNERFYGFGNADELSSPPPMPLDALAGDAALATRYRSEGGRLMLRAGFPLPAGLKAELAAAYERRVFDESESLAGDARLRDVFVVDSVTGFEEGLEELYGEIALELDRRRRPNRFVWGGIPGAGPLARAYAGYHHPLFGDRRGFFRYGVDLQYVIDLYAGDRVLALRLLAEEVIADRDEAPFARLPTIGGKELLRGYQADRFRDTAFTIASAEYEWELTPPLSASLFVDVGRVQRGLGDARLQDLRVGYGAGIEAQTPRTLLFRGQVASSADGGIFFDFAVTPPTEVELREL